jgi:uncharacterized protein
MSCYPDAVILVFCKAPLPGQVKTRLIPQLSPEQAAQVHCELTLRTLETVTANNLCRVQLWGSPTNDHPFFSTLANRSQLELKTQQGEDLGAKMHHAFMDTLQNHQSAVLIGCDCPSLTTNDVAQALEHLHTDKDCVLAPAEDGGYVLIGLKQPQPKLFADMPWGTNQVLPITRQKAHDLDLAYQEITPQWDVDTPADYTRYLSLLAK